MTFKDCILNYKIINYKTTTWIVVLLGSVNLAGCTRKPGG